MSTSQSLFDSRYGSTIRQNLKQGKIDPVLNIASHPFFKWPEDGTKLMAKHPSYKPFHQLIQYMKYNLLKGFQWHPETIQTCIKYHHHHNKDVFAYISSHGCPVTRSDLLYMVQGGYNQFLLKGLEYVTINIQEDLDLQIEAINSGHVQTLATLLRAQEKIHPDALSLACKKGNQEMFDCLCKLNPFTKEKQDPIYMTYAACFNHTHLVEKGLRMGFQYNSDILEQSIRSDAYKSVERLLTRDFTYIDVNNMNRVGRLFHWNVDLIYTAITYNSYHTLKWIMDYGSLLEGLPISLLWPSDVLEYSLHAEQQIRTKQMPLTIKTHNNNPFYSIRYAYQNGALVPLDFLNQIKSLIRDFSIELSSSIKDWINTLESNPMFQIMSLIPVKKPIVVSKPPQLLHLNHDKPKISVVIETPKHQPNNDLPGKTFSSI